MNTAKLDSLVAGLVMGYLPGGRNSLHAANGNTYYSSGCRYQWLDDFGPSSEIWEPSTNPAAAWEVVKKLQASHNPPFFVTIVAYAHGSKDFGCTIVEGQYGERPDKQLHYARADEMPEAVCLAALMAVTLRDEQSIRRECEMTLKEIEGK